MLEARVIQISTGTIIKTLALLAAFYALYLVRDIVVMLFGAVIVASAIEPVANWGERLKVPRVVTVLFVYLALILILTGMGALMVQPLAHQARSLAQEVPRVITQLSEFMTFLPKYDQQEAISAIQGGLTKFGNNIAGISVNIFRSTRTFITGVVNLLFVFVIALYLVAEKDALAKLGRLLAPAEYEPYVMRALSKAQKSLGKWVLAQIALGVIVGTIVGIGLWILGIPYALLLALLAGLMEFVPIIGPLISTVPGLLVALSQSWTMVLVVWIFYMIVGQLEGNVLVPNIMKRAVGMKPLVTMVAVLIGAKLLGILGIILAVPVANTIKIFLTELMGETNEVKSVK